VVQSSRRAVEPDALSEQLKPVASSSAMLDEMKPWPVPPEPELTTSVKTSTEPRSVSLQIPAGSGGAQFLSWPTALQT